VFLQQLAVIGREFSLGLVRQIIAQPDDDLSRMLTALQHKEFLYEQPAFPEVQYIFKHALTQEVAYNSVLIERRKVLHEQTGQTIERLFSDRLEEHYGELAHHYSRSGNTEKAIEYLHKAGQQAAQNSAHTEAISHFTTALDLLKTLPDTSQRGQRELSLQLTLAASLQVTKGPSAPEVGIAYARARVLCQQGGDERQLFAVLRGLWLLHHVRADLAAAREAGEQLLTMAERIQRNELDIALIGGAESMHTRWRARKEPRVELTWENGDDAPCEWVIGDDRPGSSQYEMAHMAVAPTMV